MFKALWNNFYSSVVRNASSMLKGSIISCLIIAVLLCVVSSFKGGKEGKPIKNWFTFWLGVLLLLLLIGYIILLEI